MALRHLSFFLSISLPTTTIQVCIGYTSNDATPSSSPSEAWKYSGIVQDHCSQVRPTVGIINGGVELALLIKDTESDSSCFIGVAYF